MNPKHRQAKQKNSSSRSSFPPQSCQRARETRFANSLQATAVLERSGQGMMRQLRRDAFARVQAQHGNAHVQRFVHSRPTALQRVEDEAPVSASVAASTEDQTTELAADEENDWLSLIYEQGTAALDGVVAMIDNAAETLGELVSDFGATATAALPEAAQPAADAPAESEPLEPGAAALASAIASGERNANILTDIVFYARYPERQDKPIDPNTEKDLIAVWKEIYSNEVKPALAAPVQDAPEQTPGQETPAGETEAPVAVDPGESGPVEALLAALADHDEIQAINAVVVSLTEIQNAIDGPDSDENGNEKKLSTRKLWQAIEDTSQYALYKEGSDEQHDQMVALLATAREQVSGLTTQSLQSVVPEITDEQTAQIIGYYHRHLNTLTPFFTQQANMDVLHKGGRDTAWKRTCNVTSLSMVLLSLGVGADAFSGDRTTLVNIAQHLEPSITSWEHLMSLRMPDFVQFVAVYTEYKDGPEEGFGDRVDKARDTVAPKVSTTLDIFTAIVQYFGVERTHSGYIDSHGTAIRTNKDLAADKQLDPNSFKTSKFKADVVSKVSPWIDAGGQIVVNRPGHYLRLQNFDDSGVTFDDPGDEGKNFHVSWDESNKIGHFRSWQVFEKG